MTEKDKTDESIRFVTGHYQDDTLLPGAGWRQFRLTHHISSFRRNVAAACIGAVVLAASASIYYITTRPESAATVENVATPAETAVASELRIERIEFHDAPLGEVVAEIERVYGVDISNVPDKDMRITISYEGTAEDVVETINDLLDISLSVNPISNPSTKK